jgi:hypothetical protein
MLKIGVKGKLIKGLYAPLGEILIEEDKDNFDKEKCYYYIYIWPNDGTKWPGTDKDMVYDYWIEDLKGVEAQLKFLNAEVEWYDEKPSSDKSAKNPNTPSTSES